MQDDALAAWLGPAADALTAEQTGHVANAARLISEYYPGPDRQHERDAALSAVVQHLLSETTPEETAQSLRSAILAESTARAAAVGMAVAMVAAGEHKATSARRVGIDRMDLLTALGERPRRRKPQKQSGQPAGTASHPEHDRRHRATPAGVKKIALTKQTRAGTATVAIEQSDTAGLVAVARLNGKTVLGRHCGPHHQAAGLPSGYVAAIGRLALTQEEADQVAAEYQLAEAALPRDLHAERRALVDAANAAEHEYAAERAAAVDTGAFATYLAGRDDRAKASVDIAWQAVNRFDDEHPKIAAQVAETRERQVSEWMDR